MKRRVPEGHGKRNNTGSLKTLGLKVRMARELLGYNQLAFAEKIGMHRVNLSNLEKGKMKPSFDTLCAIVEITKKPMSYFFDEESKFTYSRDIEELKKQISEIKEELHGYKTKR